MLSACEESEVKVPPVIEELVIETDSIQIEAYMSFSFTYRFTDNTGLSKFKVRIEDEFEGARLSAAPWNLEEEYDLDYCTELVKEMEVAFKWLKDLLTKN